MGQYEAMHAGKGEEKKIFFLDGMSERKERQYQPQHYITFTHCKCNTLWNGSK